MSLTSLRFKEDWIKWSWMNRRGAEIRVAEFWAADKAYEAVLEEPLVAPGSQQKGLFVCPRSPSWREQPTEVLLDSRIWHLLVLLLSAGVPAGSPSLGGDVTIYVLDMINHPSFAHSFSSVLVSISVLTALSTVFHSIISPDNSPLSHSVLLVLFCRIGPFY